MKKAVNHLCFALLYTTAGVLLGIAALYFHQIEKWPDIELWHTATLDEEFSAEHQGRIRNFKDYLKLEDRLFKQLEKQVISQIPQTAERKLNRYSAGSLVDPGNQRINWNHSFEMFARPKIGGVLMLHGLSDSPYSMKNLGRFLNSNGFHVVGLRLPGHGTAPAGLLHATWKDFAAATRIAARYLRDQLEEGQPLYILGYSNGASLAVEYSLSVLEGEALPPSEGLILLSPALGVSPVAALAQWQAKLAVIPGLEKLRWSPILPEFDPYKYNSFAVLAGQQIYDLTSNIADRIQKLSATGGLKQFPKTIAFQSAADSTIPPASIVENLMRYLHPGDKELVIFDINRFAEAHALLNPDAGAIVRQYLDDSTLPFDLTVITNREPETREIMALRKTPLSNLTESRSLNLRWPPGIFSLSHLALPFPPTDPLYGELHSEDPNTISLGNVELKGERDVLVIPTSFFQRLRYNPFYEYMQERILAAIAPSSEILEPLGID